MRSWINILSIALIYCGTVFGAGFASGQEIVRFFSSYGWWGIAASVFVGFLFSFFGYAVCVRAKQYHLDNAAEYFDFLFTKGMSRVLRFLCVAFLVVSFCIMIAGCGTLMQEQFSLRPVFGALFSLALCYFIIKNKVNGLARLNSVITPFLFFGVTALCILCFWGGAVNYDAVPAGKAQSALFSGILYLSYNMVSAAAVLAPCAGLATTKREAGVGAILGGVLVGLPLVLMSSVLTLFPMHNGEQLPFFSLVCQMHGALKPACGLLLYGAMLTTAASSGVSALARVPKAYSGKSAAALCVVAFFASFIPFATLVKTMYTTFGICGLLLIAGITKSIFSKQ